VYVLLEKAAKSSRVLAVFI